MERKKVIVIGAGLSGLTAAYRLKTDMPQLDVSVLEASTYPGGRIITTDFGGEGGPEFFGSYFKALFDLAKEIKVPIESVKLDSALNIAYYWNATKEWVKQSDWAAWKNNPLPSELRAIPPIMLFPYFVKKFPTPNLQTIFEDRNVRELTNQTLLEYLKAQKIPLETLPFIESYFEINTDISKMSAFSAFMKIWISPTKFDPNLYYLKDGFQQLCIILSEKIKNIRYKQKVSKVERTDRKNYRISTEQGDVFESDYVIFSIPGTLMKQVKMEPPLEGMQKEAFDKLSYSPSIVVFFKALSPFWEKDNLPVTMWMNNDLNVASAVYNKDTRLSPISGPDIWGICIKTLGKKATNLYEGQKKGEPIHVQCQKILEEIRPSIKGCLQHEQTIDWGHYPFELGGFSYYPPNKNIPLYYENMVKPSLGRYFIGEHTEYLFKGLNAAVTSGVRAAKELIQDLETEKKVVYK